MNNCICYKCGVAVPADIMKHNLSVDGHILCDKCSKDVELMTYEQKKNIKELQK